MIELRGDRASAEPMYAEALAMRQRLFPGDHPDVAWSMFKLARARLALGQRDPAHENSTLELARQAAAMAERVLRAGDPSLARYRELVAQCEGAPAR